MESIWICIFICYFKLNPFFLHILNILYKDEIILKDITFN